MESRKVSEEMEEDLYRVLVSLENEEDCRALLEDLCTRKEVEQMAQRIRAARLLKEGKTYQQVIAETDISSATLSRVSGACNTAAGTGSCCKPAPHRSRKQLSSWKRLFPPRRVTGAKNPRLYNRVGDIFVLGSAYSSSNAPV